MKIGDEVYIHGFVDEIRKDTVIIRNKGGYFGTDAEEVAPTVSPDMAQVLAYECGKAERKRGKWIEQEDGWGGYYYDCSVCKESWTTIDGTPWDNGMNFCPNCGAEMAEK